MTIDGRDYKSQTGGLVKVNLPYGVYDFLISAPHYISYQGKVNLSGEPVFFPKNKLVPKDGHVIICLIQEPIFWLWDKTKGE